MEKLSIKLSVELKITENFHSCQQWICYESVETLNNDLVSYFPLRKPLWFVCSTNVLNRRPFRMGLGRYFWSKTIARRWIWSEWFFDKIDLKQFPVHEWWSMNTSEVAERLQPFELMTIFPKGLKLKKKRRLISILFFILIKTNSFSFLEHLPKKFLAVMKCIEKYSGMCGSSSKSYGWIRFSINFSNNRDINLKAINKCTSCN